MKNINYFDTFVASMLVLDGMDQAQVGHLEHLVEICLPSVVFALVPLHIGLQPVQLVLVQVQNLGHVQAKMYAQNATDP